jgi:hypothetical protein
VDLRPGTGNHTTTDDDAHAAKTSVATKGHAAKTSVAAQGVAAKGVSGNTATITTGLSAKKEMFTAKAVHHGVAERCLVHSQLLNRGAHG